MTWLALHHIIMDVSVCVPFLGNIPLQTYTTYYKIYDLESSELSMKTVHHFQLILAQTVHICTAGSEIVPLYIYMSASAYYHADVWTAAKKNSIKQIFELMYVVEAHCYVVDKRVKI